MRRAMVLLVLAGCRGEKSPPVEPPDEPQRVERADGAAPTPPGSGPTMVPDGARPTRAKLGLELRRAAAQTVTFGRDRLARIRGDAVDVLSVKGWSVVGSFPLEGARRVFALRDGSLALVGRERLARLEHDEEKPSSAPTPTVFPGTQLFFDPRRSQAYWALQLGAVLYEHTTEPSEARLSPALSTASLPVPAGAPVGQLPDGALLLADGARLVHEYPGGKRRELPVGDDLANVRRVLPGDRIDRAWLVLDGRANLVTLGDPVRVVETVELGPGVFDVDARGRVLAALRAEPRDDGGLVWKLTTWSTRGDRLADVPTGAPARGTRATEGWLAEETRDRDLAVSPDGRWVAVGGPGVLAVHDARTGRVVHSAK